MPNRDTVLIVRPVCDIGCVGPNFYGAVLTEPIVSEANRLGYNIVELKGANATKANVEAALLQYDPLLYLGHGHGEATWISGEYVEHTIEQGINQELLKDRLVYTLSCWSAQRLGPAVVSAGGIAYMAYDQDFGWLTTDPAHPELDKYARPFFNISNQIAISILNGKTFGEAKEVGLKLFNDEIANWKQSQDKYAGMMITWLIHDRDALNLSGNSRASVTEVKPEVALEVPTKVVIPEEVREVLKEQDPAPAWVSILMGVALMML